MLTIPEEWRDVAAGVMAGLIAVRESEEAVANTREALGVLPDMGNAIGLLDNAIADLRGALFPVVVTRTAEPDATGTPSVPEIPRRATISAAMLDRVHAASNPGVMVTSADTLGALLAAVLDREFVDAVIRARVHSISARDGGWIYFGKEKYAPRITIGGLLSALEVDR